VPLGRIIGPEQEISFCHRLCGMGYGVWLQDLTEYRA